MTPDLRDSYDCVPESLSSATTLFELHRQELVDAAALLRLAGDGTSRVTGAVDRMADFHDAELQQNLLTRQALLDGELAFVEEDLARRAELLPKLEANYELRTKLGDGRAAVAAELVELEVELLSRRNKAETERLQRELQDTVESAAAETDMTVHATPDSVAAPVQSAAEAARAREIDELKRRREEVLAAEQPTFEREEQLRARSVTRTVSGFLLWLGYASVVATGSVLALVMSGPDTFDLRPLAAGMRAFVASVFPSWPPSLRLFVALSLILLLLWLVARVFVECDKLLRKQWQWQERSRGDATAQISPQALTPRTYASVVAFLPFVFAVATVMTVLALAPPQGVQRDGDGGFLASMFPGVGYSFIGIAIAFLATAVFAMYFVHVIQPRTAGRAGVLRAGWEFTLPPILLIGALALTPLHQDVVAARWLPWAAFMLLSSLALACGLVYHGIFKDARRGRERLVRLDKRLQRLTGVPAEDAEDEADQPRVAETARAGRAAWLVRQLQRIKDRKIRPPAEPSADGPPPDQSSLSVSSLVPFYRVTDVEAAPELVRRIEERRSAATRMDAAIADLNTAIAELESLLSYEAMNALRRRRHMLQAIRIALVPHQEERRNHSRIAKERLLLDVHGAEVAAAAIDPLVRSVREAGGTAPEGAAS